MQDGPQTLQGTWNAGGRSARQGKLGISKHWEALGGLGQLVQSLGASAPSSVKAGNDASPPGLWRRGREMPHVETHGTPEIPVHVLLQLSTS